MALRLLHQNVLGKLKHFPSQLQVGRLLFIFFLSGCYVFFLCSVTLDRIIFSIFSIGGPGGIKFLAASGLGRLSIFAVGNLDFHLFIFRAGTFAIRSGLAFFFRACGSCLGTSLSLGFLVDLGASLSVGLLVDLGASLAIGHLLVRLGTSLAILGAGHLLIFGCRARFAVGL